MNLGWGEIYLCKNCHPTKTPEEIIEEISNFMFPVKENDD
jgi:hypothetical protein